MYVMRNLPTLLALSVGVIVTISGIYQGADFNEISLRLVIGLVLFYIIGVIIKNNFFNYLVRVLEEAEKRAKELKDLEYNNLMNNNGQKENDFEPYIPKKM